jgi:uncharacterized membrane protein
MKPVLFAVLAGVCWGVGELCTRGALHSGKIGPMTVLLVRAGLTLPPAILAYWIAYRVIGSEPQGWWRADSRTLVFMGLGSGLLAGFGGVFFFYLGLGSGEISVVKPIAFTLAPAVAVVLGWLVLGESMSVQKAVGIALILAGVVVLTRTQGLQPLGS